MATNKKKSLVYFLIGVCLFLISISAYEIFVWQKDTKDIDKQMDEIVQVATPEEIQSTSEDSLINPPENKSDPYWDYIKTSLINVNFEELKKVNPETKGWIQVLGTNINYPFVQHSDNTFYLDHSFNQQKNRSGWVFLDSRNDIETLDKNTILYAHGMVNTVLFGTLKNLTKDSWESKSENQIIRISTESENSLWQVFSVYRIPTTSDYLVTSFNNDQTYTNFLNFLKNRSIYNFETELTKEDKILTLSTCYSYTDKMVMHAKLIRVEKK